VILIDAPEPDARLAERGDGAPAPLLAALHLTVRYGDRLALDDFSFEVFAGEVVALLGPNGAGKTTTFSLLATLRAPDAGQAWVAGKRVDLEPSAVRSVLGLVPQSLALYPSLTARENLLFFARVLGLRGGRAREAAARVLERVGLEDRADEPVSQYSGGMRRRLNLACGVLHTPRVLLLDEPTVGVDPQSRERIFETVRAQADAGVAVLYSTHYMEEAERLCDRVLLIDHGKLVASGTPAALARAGRRALVLELVTRDPLPDGWLEGLVDADPAAARRSTPASVTRTGHAARVEVPDLASAARAVERAAARGGEVLRFDLHQPGLEELFFERTGRALRD
jgi:ABC-2 type transport system ATP-binding protein